MILQQRQPAKKSGARWRNGFTLLELVLVLALIAVALAVASPSLRGFAAGSKLKNSARQILAVTKWARTQAASDARVYRLNIEPDGYSVTVDQDGQFVDQMKDLGQKTDLADGVKASVVKDQGGDTIDFFPDGRTEPAQIRLTREDEQMWVICSGPAESFHIASSAEMERTR